MEKKRILRERDVLRKGTLCNEKNCKQGKVRKGKRKGKVNMCKGRKFKKRWKNLRQRGMEGARRKQKRKGKEVKPNKGEI